ncbi:hypothetical protein GmHk_04G010742 [Glycine max]|nr:hypothetical protein GmHk_04G010742 [Glycine max]
MLQSIHQGQIILLQSLHVVAPPRSIPSVEQFTELVAWPGTQPSLHREGEGPTAQVPQHVEDESSEATIPEPFVIGEEAEETQVRQLAADPSTPLLEMPEDPTTSVLAMDTSPLATPVLHLTDEEDVQTQDTQDQSQEF